MELNFMTFRMLPGDILILQAVDIIEKDVNEAVGRIKRIGEQRGTRILICNYEIELGPDFEGMKTLKLEECAFTAENVDFLIEQLKGEHKSIIDEVKDPPTKESIPRKRYSSIEIELNGDDHLQKVFSFLETIREDFSILEFPESSDKDLERYASLMSPGLMEKLLLINYTCDPLVLNIFKEDYVLMPPCQGIIELKREPVCLLTESE